MNRATRAIYLVLAVATTIDGFGVAPPPATRRCEPHATVPSSLTQLRMGWADAFKNDSSLGKAPNAGLSNGPNFNDNVTVNGKPVPGAVVGQKLTVVAGKVRVKVPVNCQKGDCGTCVVNLNGRKVKGM